jgi:short-subunit dehydrogenase
MHSSHLQEKVVVVTGASSGLGRGVALRFAGAGARVILAARRGNLLDQVAQLCELDGGHGLAVPTDVSQEDQVENLAQTALDKFGQIDYWINCAGAGAVGRFEEIPLALNSKVIEIDLLGSLYGSYYAMRQFRKQGHGSLINIASVLGKVSAPYFAAYSAAKHGIVGLGAALREEIRGSETPDIHVCTVLPAGMDTLFLEHMANYTGYKSESALPVYHSEDVVEAIYQLTHEPAAEITVGASGKFASLAHSLAPGLTEAVMSKRLQTSQLGVANHKKDGPGSLQDPVTIGTTGGWGDEGVWGGQRA